MSIVPPGINPVTDKPLAWMNDDDLVLAPMPSAWLDAAGERRNGDGPADEEAWVEEPGRRTWLLSMLGAARRHGAGYEALRALAETAGATQCSPEFPEDEAEQLAREVAKLPAAEMPDEQWETMLGAIPEYPVEALPPAGQDLVREAAEAGLSPALVGGAALAALAIAVGSESELPALGKERAILRIPLLAPAGTGKSPAQTLAFEPLRSSAIRLLGNLTLEALVRELVKNPTAPIVPDELATWIRGLGQYKRGSSGDSAIALELWSGTPQDYHRVAGGTDENKVQVHVERPTVTICGGLQPHLHHLLGVDEDGFRHRWLPHLAPLAPVADELPVDGPPESWSALLKRMVERAGITEHLDDRVRWEQRRVWKLDPEALECFQDYRYGWKLHARETMESESVRGALDKADTHLARIALVLAEADWSDRDSLVVTADVVERAALIVDFALTCWRALPPVGGLAYSRKDEVLTDAVERVRAWIELHGGETTGRDLQRANVAGIRTSSQRDEVLKLYEATYPGCVTKEHPRTGRPSVIVRAPKRVAGDTP